MSGAAVAAAVVATAVAVDVGTTFAIVAAVGAVVGAVGVVANIPALKIAGGIIGAVGAVGGLASAAGIFSGAASGSGSIFDAGGLASDGGFAGAVGSDVAAGGGGAVSAQAQALVDAGLDPGIQSAGISSSVAGGATTATPDIINTISGQVTTPDQALTSAPVNAQTPDVTPAAATNQANAPVEFHDSATATLDSQGVPTTTTPGTPTVNAPTTPSVTGTPSVTDNILSGGQGVTGTPSPGTTVTGAPLAGQSTGGISSTAPSVAGTGTGLPPSSAFGDVWSFLKNNQTLVGMTVQGGSALIAGATDSLKPAQVKALNAQADANQAAANLSANQLANLQGAIPTARRVPPQGLVNSAPVSGAA